MMLENDDNGIYWVVSVPGECWVLDQMKTIELDSRGVSLVPSTLFTLLLHFATWVVELSLDWFSLV